MRVDVGLVVVLPLPRVAGLARSWLSPVACPMKVEMLMCSVVPTWLLYQSSEELKGLLETALTTQKEALIAHWGKNVAEEAKIDRY